MTSYINSNLFEALKKSSTGNNGITFVDDKGSSFITYKELYNRSLGISGFLCSNINPSENEIIILLDTNKDFVPVFWACIAARIKAIPVAVGNSDEHKLKLFNVWDNLKSPYLITTKAISDKLENFAEQNNLHKAYNAIQNHVIFYEEINETPLNVLPVITIDDIAFIQYSSGSTGTPKGIILTHKNLIITVSAFINALRINSKDSFLSWFPLTHDMGVIGWHIVPLVAGINQVLIETSLFVRRPSLWMDKATEHKSTILCSPNFGLKHFLSFTKKLDNAEWDLSNVRLIANGAEPISPKLCEDFLTALEPYKLRHSAMSPGYGLAEVGLIASISDYETDFESIHLDRTKLNIGMKISETNESSPECLSFVCEGEFIPEMKVKITDDKGIKLNEEHIGHICLKGDSVTSGYYNNTKATKQVIKKGWLDSGDLGFLKDNKLYLTGRSKELIIINGYNYYPHDIERVCLSIDELDLGKVVAAGVYEEYLDQEVLIVFIYFKGDLEKFSELSIKIKEIILKSVGLNVYKVIPVKKIPKTTSGKVQRYVMLESYKQGEFSEVISKLESINKTKDETQPHNELSKEFVIEKLKALVNKVINLSDIDINETLINYGIDSIRGTELLGRIKAHFEIELYEFIFLPDLSLTVAAEIVLKNSTPKKLNIDAEVSKQSKDSNTNIHQALSGQFAIYYHYKNQPSSAAYNISIAYRVLNDVNIDKLNKAYNFVLNRHEILRAKYFMTDALYYKVDKRSNNNIEVITTDENNYDSLKTIVKKNAEAPFDIENDCVIRSFLYKTKNYGRIFLVNLHHIAGDARSLFILLNEILSCYNELDKDDAIKSFSPKSECNYSEFVNEEIKYLNSISAEKAKEYWTTNLSGADFGLNLPDAVNDSQQNEASSMMFEVEGWKTLHSKNISNFTFMLSVYCYLLHRYTRQKEVIVGIPVSDNNVLSNKKMNRELIGYTINTLPIKSTLNNSETVSEYLERMKLTILNAMKYQHYPLTKIAEGINPFRNNGDGLFRTMFTALPVSSADKLSGLADSLIEEYEIEFGNLRLKPFYIPQQESLFKFSLEMVEYNDRMVFRVSYNSRKYNKNYIESFIDRFKIAAQKFASSSSTILSGIEIISDKEKQLLESFNETRKTFHNYKPVIKLIEEQSLKTPENIAYIFNDKYYSYEWINGKANGLANELMKTGLKKGSFVPVFMKKGIELPISILAVMKTGCTFIPLDVDTPERRLNSIINDINPKIILTTKEHFEKLLFVNSAQIIFANAANIVNVNANPDIEISLDDSIYGIYTSGTTGIPKCAVNLQKGITNKFKYMDDYFGTDERRVVFHSANIIFDTSIYQLFWALTHGAKVVIPESSEKLNLDNMLDFIKKYQVTFIELVPSVFNILVEYFENNREAENKFRSITHLSLGGEAVVPVFINRFRMHFPDVKIANIYGPTETAIGITYFDVHGKVDEIPIGKPMSNAQIFILDENMNRMPVGIPGEIYIGGECVGAGYLNDPYKTANAFVGNIITGIGKFYKTGDLGCYLPDGNILFKGRADEQVKIRGVRIEPDEIRTNILKVDFVRDAVVVAKENSSEEMQLVAYVVFKNGNHNTGELKNELLKSLPDILIPQYFIKIDEVPLNANGKINKGALPEINIADNVYIEDNNARTSKLLNIWREVLGREDINVHDKFFNCGGNSLKALLLKIKIQQNYGIELSIENILSNPSVSRLEEELSKHSPEEKNDIPRIEEREYYPLSNQQKRMWLICNGENSSKAYGIIGVFDIIGKVDSSVLRKSWEMLVERHESLRTKYVVVNGEPVQVVDGKGILNYIDVHTRNVDSELQNIIDSEKKYAFDLSQLPLFKIISMTDDEEKTKLVLHFHHIITDGWSTKIMFDELGSIYNSLLKGDKPDLMKLSIQYKDYSVWLERELESKYFKEAEEYWNKKLSGELQITSIPTDYEKPYSQKKKAGVKQLYISKDELEKTHQLYKEKEITLFMFLISAVDIVLSKYTGSEEIILGTPVSGRNRPEHEHQIGLYVNTIVLRNNVQKDKSYSDFINELRYEITESFKHQDYPYDKLIDEKNKNGDLFEVFVSFDGIEDEIKLALGETETKYEEIENKESKFNVSLMFREKTDGIELVIEYACDLYNGKRIELLASHIKKVLEEIIGDPNKKLNSISMLSNDEETRLLKYACTKTKREVGWKSVVDQFKDAVKENENNCAVFHRNKSLSYKQLDIESDKIASALTARGINEECIVSLMTTKSLGLIIGMIGILKAGAAYLPLDPDHPAERLKNIIKDSGCKVILTNIAEYQQEVIECELINIDELKTIAPVHEKPFRKIEPSQLAYVIYTSGSTGMPKGVMIEHHSLNNLIRSLREEVYDKYGSHLNVALQASQIFDASIQQIFPSLVRGDTLHLIDDETKLDGKRCADYFEIHKINIADATPTLFDLQLRSKFADNKLTSLKHLLIGGEALNAESLNRFYLNEKHDHIKITNMYGPTECCVDTVCLTITKNECEENGVVPIGKPMLNTCAYILDENLQLAPEGIDGELYLSGENVGRGYINNDELTKTKFIQSPFNKNEKLYRTGDLCRYSYDGNIIYSGRIDNQTKIRGYRVELGEIESVIENLIKPAKCIVIFDRNEDELIAFIERMNDFGIAANTIFKRLTEVLPAYMCPSKIISIEKLPLTKSGKPDRNKLHATIKEYDTISFKKNYEEPHSDTEIKLVGIWKEILALDDIGITDNYYELGGHSLKSLKIMSAAVKEFNVELSYKDVLVNPTIEELALIIDAKFKRKYRPIPKIEEQEYYELSHAQKRIWLECELGRSRAYNIVGAFRLFGKTDVELLEKSFKILFKRHESLRTRFEMINNYPKQVIDKNVHEVIEYIDLSFSENTEEDLHKIIAAATGKSLNIFTDNLVNFSLFKIHSEENYLLAILHHILTDGWSIKIMLEELGEIYNSLKRNVKNGLDELNIQYKDYCAWYERETGSDKYEEAEKYWNKKITGELPAVKIHSTSNKDEVNKIGKQKYFGLSKEISNTIHEFAQQKEITPFMLLLSVLELTYYKIFGSDEIVFGTPVSGRNHPDLERQLGLYTNTILLKNKIDGGKKYSDFLNDLKNEVLESYNYQDYSFDKLMEGKRKRHEGGPFDAFVSYETKEDAIKLELDGIRCEYVEIETESLKFDLAFTFRERKEIIEVVVEYASNLYAESDIENIITVYENIISAVINNDALHLDAIMADSGENNTRKSKAETIIKQASGSRYKAPKSSTEKEIAGLWKNILGIKRAGVSDNFFELGGQSIKALQLVTLLKEKYEINLDLSFVFSNQTIGEQAKEIENAVWINNSTDESGEEIII